MGEELLRSLLFELKEQPLSFQMHIQHMTG